MACSNLPPRLCETTDGLTVLLFCDVRIEIGVTLNILVPLLDVELYNAYTSLALLAHIAAQARPQYSLNALIFTLGLFL